jgi:hypothetical protein
MNEQSELLARPPEIERLDSTAASPQWVQAEIHEDGISSDQAASFHDALRREHAVEWVPMIEFPSTRPESVARDDRKLGEARLVQPL